MSPDAGGTGSTDSAAIVDALTLIHDTEKEILACQKSILALETHIHEGHWHTSAHIVSDQTTTGGSVPNNTIPYAARLIQEWSCFQDVDGNKKIFGRDFRFEVSDNLPPILKGIQRNPDMPQDIKVIKWEDLEAWNNSDGADPLADPETEA